MNILLDTKAAPKSGKGFFVKRLAEEFERQNHTVVSDSHTEHDVYLAVNGYKQKTKKPRVLRLNGVYHNKALNYRKMNDKIRKRVQKADCVIYQSKFCRDMHFKHVYTPKKYSVIYNGAPVDGNVKQNLAVEHSPIEFVMIARWRPHKRLKDMISAFLLADIEDAKLRIFGDIGQSINHKNIIVEGKCPQWRLNDALHHAKSLTHLSWIDWCPNGVVEALASGCPVITNNVGGTQELIRKGCGKVLNIDKNYDMKPVALQHPPRIDRNKVAEALIESVKWPRVTNNSHINIANVTKQYIKVFEKIL